MKSTALGTASWAKINNRYDQYQNNAPRYVIFVSFSDEDTKALKEECRQALKDYAAANPSKKVAKDGNFYDGSVTSDDGKVSFKFWCRRDMVDENGKTRKVHVPILNKATMRPLDDNASIGNGSKVRIAYTIRPYISSSKVYGVSLIMHKVLVEELVDYEDGWGVFGIDGAEVQKTEQENTVDTKANDIDQTADNDDNPFI